MKKILLILVLAGSNLLFGAESDKTLRAMIDELDSAIKAVQHNVVDIEKYLNDLSKDKYRDLLDQSMEKKLADLKRQVDVLREMEVAAFKPSDMSHGTSVRSTDEDETAMISKGIEAEIEAEVNRIYATEKLEPSAALLTEKGLKESIRKRIIAERSKAIVEAKSETEDVGVVEEDDSSKKLELIAASSDGVKMIFESDEWDDLKQGSIRIRKRGLYAKIGDSDHRALSDKKYAAYKKYNIEAYLDNVAVVEFLATKLLEHSVSKFSWSVSSADETTYSDMSYEVLTYLKMLSKQNKIKDFFTKDAQEYAHRDRSLKSSWFGSWF